MGPPSQKITLGKKAQRVRRWALGDLAKSCVAVGALGDLAISRASMGAIGDLEKSHASMGALGDFAKSRPSIGALEALERRYLPMRMRLLN